MPDFGLTAEEMLVWQRLIEERIREWIYELESIDEAASMAELVLQIIGWLKQSPKLAELFLRIEDDMRKDEETPEEKLFVKASSKRAWDIRHAKRDGGTGRKARDYIRAACREEPAVLPHQERSS